MRKTKAAYLNYHYINERTYKCEVVELGTDKVLKAFRSASLITAEHKADQYASERYVMVDYNPKTKKVSGTIDLTLDDILKNSKESFPLYLAMRLTRKFRHNLSDLRYSISDIGITGKTIGIEVEAKLLKPKVKGN